MTRNRIQHLALVLAAAGATLGTPAFAQSASANASLTGFTYQLIDLDAADGIAPEVSFFSELYETDVNHSGWNLAERQEGSQAGSIALDGTYAQGSATIAAGSASVQLQYSSAPGDNYVVAQARRNVDFTLSPNTGILFSALSNVNITGDNPITGWSTAGIDGWVTQNIGFNSSVYFADFISRPAGEQTYNLSGFAYAGSAGGQGHVEFYTSVRFNHTNPTSPVPEPASVAMLLAGLAVVGGVAARRRA